MTKRPEWVRSALMAAAIVAGIGVSGGANAGYIATLSENDCAGVFGIPFDTCAIPDAYDPNNSPVIAKFDNDTGVWEINTALFPGVEEEDFRLVRNADGSGTWTYTPDNNGDLDGDGQDDFDPLVTFYVAKGGNNFNLFGNGTPVAGPFPAPQIYGQVGPYPNTNTWFTPTNPQNGRPFGLSHVTFYDSAGGGGQQQVPEPTLMLLTALGLIGVGMVRRRGRT